MHVKKKVCMLQSSKYRQNCEIQFHVCFLNVNLKYYCQKKSKSRQCSIIKDHERNKDFKFTCIPYPILPDLALKYR